MSENNRSVSVTPATAIYIEGQVGQASSGKTANGRFDIAELEIMTPDGAVWVEYFGASIPADWASLTIRGNVVQADCRLNQRTYNSRVYTRLAGRRLALIEPRQPAGEVEITEESEPQPPEELPF